MPRDVAGTFDRLLVRLPNWLGDVLLARPTLHALRHAHPRATVAAVGPAPLLELLATDGVVDRAWPWPRGRAGASGRAETMRALRLFRPQAALVLPPSFSSAWLAWRSGARVRVGHRGEARSMLLTRALRRPARGDVHLSREYLALGATLGAVATPVPDLAPPHAATTPWAALRARLGLTGRPAAVLGPGAIFGPAKRWAADRFAALGRRLVAAGHDALVCGAAAERDVCREVAEAIGPGAYVLAGETDLGVQTAVCAAARVAVCNDSGLAHLAAATGTPTVAIFGSTSSAWTAPLGRRVRVVQRAPVCSPCFQRTCAIGTICLAAVTVDDVERAVIEAAA